MCKNVFSYLSRLRQDAVFLPAQSSYPEMKILCAATKTWHSQINFKKYDFFLKKEITFLIKKKKERNFTRFVPTTDSDPKMGKGEGQEGLKIHFLKLGILTLFESERVL